MARSRRGKNNIRSRSKESIVAPTNAKKPRRVKSLATGRARIACSSCYTAKTACDPVQRPCSRCVRLEKGDTCVDRVHKTRNGLANYVCGEDEDTDRRRELRRIRERERREKMKLQTRSQSMPTFSNNSMQASVALTNVVRAESLPTLPPAKDLSGLSAQNLSLTDVANVFSHTLNDVWTKQPERFDTFELRSFHNVISRSDEWCIFAAETLLGGMLNVHMYPSVRNRLSSIGIQLSETCSTIRNNPLTLLTPAQAGEVSLPASVDPKEPMMAIIKFMQVISPISGVPSTRGVYVNEEASKLFGFTGAELCTIFNRQSHSTENIDLPFWTWLIVQSDWDKVIQHNAHLFLTLSSVARTYVSNERSLSDTTLVVRVVHKNGEIRRCLASTRFGPTGPHWFSFCFLRLI